MSRMMNAPRGRGGQIARICETLGVTVSGLNILADAERKHKGEFGTLRGGPAACKLEDQGFLKTVSHLDRKITPAGLAAMEKARELGW